MALALATAGTAQAGIQLSKILPNPAVAPVGQTLTNAEFVVVKNTAAKAKNLRGWFIREKHSKRTFTFPGFSLCGGCSVKIHSGTGTNTASDLYWGRAKQAWANDSGKAILHRARRRRSARRSAARPSQAPASGGLTWSTSRSIVAPSG